MNNQTPLMPHLCVPTRPRALPEATLTVDGLRVTVLTERLFRVERGVFTDEATQTVWYRDFAAVPFTWTRENAVLRIKTAAVTLVLDEGVPGGGYVRFADGGQASLDNSGNLLGTCRTLDTDGTRLSIDPSVTQFDRAHIPLGFGVCSRSGAAVYDDSESLLLLADGALSPREGGTDQYVFAYGHDYSAAVRALYRLCGPTPVLPRWALGNWWSRYWPYTQQEYINLMDNFADDGIPISVAVLDVDWHYVRVDEDLGAAPEDGDGWTGYTWNRKLFPQHADLLQELHDRGMHTSLNLHPAQGIRWFEKPYREMARAMGGDPESQKAVPFAIADSRFVNGYLNVLHHPLEDEGVDFWWIDWQQGTSSGLTGLDPLWALNHYHYLDSVHRRGEGLILSRYAGVGSHRCPAGFSGDTHMDWAFLDLMPWFTATAANVGYGWWSHDIGGHQGGERDEELYLRWLQFGVFSPINRLHCCFSPVVSKEPWSLGEGSRTAAEKWLRFRHRLSAYLYSASWKNFLDGVPLIRPMYYEWPEEDAAYHAEGQYLFGGLLAAPITSKARSRGLADKRVWLPEGDWTDIFTNARYRGGRWVTVVRDAAAMPVFAGEGTVLPLAAKITNDCAPPDGLDIWAYNGTGDYTLREGAEDCTEFRMERASDTEQRLTIGNGPRRRDFHVFFKNIEDGDCRLLVNGRACPVRLRRNRCLQAAFALEPSDRAELIIKWQPSDSLDVLRREMLRHFIRLPGDNRRKEMQWRETAGFTAREDWEAWITALALDEADMLQLQECLYGC